jgi:hypothetical protein
MKQSGGNFFGFKKGSTAARNSCDRLIDADQEIALDYQDTKNRTYEPSSVGDAGRTTFGGAEFPSPHAKSIQKIIIKDDIHQAGLD